MGTRIGLLFVALAAAFYAAAEPVVIQAGDLELVIEKSSDGIRVASLVDMQTGQALAAADQPPLFLLRTLAGKKAVEFHADKGWRKVDIRTDETAVNIAWAGPVDDKYGEMDVAVTGGLDPATDSINWRLHVALHPKEGSGSKWAVEEVVFPQLALNEFGKTTALFVPEGPGVLHTGVWSRKFGFHQRYPNGWGTMQYMAAYAQPEQGKAATGLYFAQHDPLGAVKEIVAVSDGVAPVRLYFEHPAPDMGRTDTFELPGPAVWRLFRGDWFDAAVIYRDWVRANAKWWPQLTADGRPDTPLWMRELSAWAQFSGAPAEVAPVAKEFAQWMGIPVGFHWYNWHQIPFDNDYPHYFPPKEGFAEAVKEMQANGVYVMPYINGRLWDTLDQGAEDGEFTAKALPAVTKDEDGKPRTETYGSKEANGNPVKLGVMCPSTPLWQQTVKDIVLRLETELGVMGVYIDQVAAAPPVLCMDAAHGHPRGGGAWWNQSYWQLVQNIRAEMPADRMLTTECNAEPFAHCFDGYLTWHWQRQSMVPAFSAVYGGTIQLFGRSYGGGSTADLALRVKAGQQLVFGEQLGWLDPRALKNLPSAEFFRQAARLRHQFRRYFYAGEMARPPSLAGDVPAVKADWQWNGETWIETPAVMTGAWRIPAEKTTILILANVSDNAVSAALHVDLHEYGFENPDKVEVETFSSEAAPAPHTTFAGVSIPAKSVFIWELKEKP